MNTEKKGFKEIIGDAIELAVPYAIAAGLITFGYKFGRKVITLKVINGLAVCFKEDPTLEDHLKGVLDKVNKKS